MLTPAPTPTFIGAFPVILGVFFMVNARTEIIDIMAPGSIPKGNKDESFFQGVMVHYMFYPRHRAACLRRDQPGALPRLPRAARHDPYVHHRRRHDPLHGHLPYGHCRCSSV